MPVTPRTRQILLPSGLASEEDAAFRMALRFCVDERAKLTVLHVGPEDRDDVPWGRFPRVRKVLEGWGLLPAGSTPDDVWNHLGVSIEKRAIHGDDALQGVRKYMEMHSTDLIVMSTEGRSALVQLISPSVAEPIAASAAAPSLLMPASRPAPLRASDGALRLFNILVPVGAMIDHTRTLALAADLATRSCEPTVTITLLHVGTDDVWVRSLKVIDDPRIHWNRLVRSGQVVETVVGVARELEAELLVMATSGRDSLLDRLAGTNTEQILRAVQRPVLAVPEAKERS
jgi:nucleotide-binding universal stress UspA family protein